MKPACSKSQPHTCQIHFSADYPIPAPPDVEKEAIRKMFESDPNDPGQHHHHCDCDGCQEAMAQDLEGMDE